MLFLPHPSTSITTSEFITTDTINNALETVSSLCAQVSFDSDSTSSNSLNIRLSTPPDPVTIVSTFTLVTLSDMVPFVPCQPLAISLGATLGIWALPICIFGQTFAGILAFLSARSVTNAAETNNKVQEILNNLGDDAKEKFYEFRQLGSTEDEKIVLLALIGLRLSPFFPFSAGNYLLGGGTKVNIRLFIIATLFGCILSNSLSIGVGMGGIDLIQL